MTPDQIARIQMMPVSFTNELYGDEDGKRRAPRRCPLCQHMR